MGKSMPAFIYDTVTTIKPRFHPKVLKFLEEDTTVGYASIKKCNTSRIY
jgi:hypothetical protein